MIEQALLERGILGIVVLALGIAVVKLYNELGTQRERHLKDISNLQVTLTEANRDNSEQLVEAHKESYNRLLAIVTSQAEMQERQAHSQTQTIEALQQIRQGLNDSRNSQPNSNNDAR